MNKKIFPIIILFVVLTLFGAQAVLAGTAPAGTTEPTPVAEESEKSLLRTSLDTAATEPGLIPTGDVTDIPSLVGKVISIALQFVSLLFLIIMIYAGLRWMTANGDPAKVKEARSHMIHSAIGLAITLMSYQVTVYIIEKVGNTITQ
ncbi:MAG: hypothetical protein UT02_C0044G0005 [Parcubacteria group bacterium GW2011_GWC2_38_7]|nr:MAG: hypothetical protein UT02_C0044G0005 [Parcubacteria group bacterium GW2011_GWC2_38_7]